MAEKSYDVGASPLLGWVRRRFRVTDGLRGERFWVREPDPDTGRPALQITPLFLALLMVEFVDVVFAVDSVPAIFRGHDRSVHRIHVEHLRDPGLRALYFALAAMIDRFHYLKHALAPLLVFIGSRIFVADALALAKVPLPVSLGVTAAILAAGVGRSLWKTRAKMPPYSLGTGGGGT